MQATCDRHAEAASIRHDRRHASAPHRLLDRPRPRFERRVRHAWIDAPRRLEQPVIERLFELHARLHARPARRRQQRLELVGRPGLRAAPQQGARMRKHVPPDPEHPSPCRQIARDPQPSIEQPPEQVDDRTQRRTGDRTARRSPPRRCESRSRVTKVAFWHPTPADRTEFRGVGVGSDVQLVRRPLGQPLEQLLARGVHPGIPFIALGIDHPFVQRPKRQPATERPIDRRPSGAQAKRG
ncbi:MAG: hypothetical protein ACO4BU_07515 [Phycisphaerales bacterium]